MSKSQRIRDVRLASFFWIQSMGGHGDTQRTMLFVLDHSVQKMAAIDAHTQLFGCYQNLLRMWSEV